MSKFGHDSMHLQGLVSLSFKQGYFLNVKTNKMSVHNFVQISREDFGNNNLQI